MDNTPNNIQKNTSNEIDLLELFASILKNITMFFNSLALFIIRIIVFYFRNIIIIIGSLLIAIGIVYFFIPLNTKVYKTDLIAKSYILDNTDVVNSINKIQNLDLSFNKEGVNTKVTGHYLLDINHDGKWDVKESYADVIRNNNTATLDTNIIKKRVKSFFCIELEVSDSTIIPKAKLDILKFIFDNENVDVLTKLKNKQDKEMLQLINKEIVILDSLKKNEYFNSNEEHYKSSTNEMFLINEKETKLYHKDIDKLMRKKQGLERSLSIYNEPYHIISDFLVPKPTLIFNSLAEGIFLLLFAIGTLLALIIDKKCVFTNRIKEFYRNKL